MSSFDVPLRNSRRQELRVFTAALILTLFLSTSAGLAAYVLLPQPKHAAYHLLHVHSRKVVRL